MLEIWNAEVQNRLTRGHKAVLTAKRRELLEQRWREDFQQDIKAWQYYCEIIGNSDFCLGKMEGKDWSIDLTWAIKSSDHIAKVLEGGFSGGKHPPKPPKCHDPELQSGWDHVLACFINKSGKSACNSWLANIEVSGVESQPDGQFVIITCPNQFIHEWLEQHYQADLNLWWTEHTYNSRRITGIQLKIKEARK